MAFIAALASSCLRAITRNVPASRRATRINRGRISTLSRVRRQSIVSMTISRAMTWMMLVMMVTMTLLMAFCAPTTSLFRRLINSPTLVLVKKRSDMLCKREYSAMRRS